MNLAAFLTSAQRGTAASIARALGVHPVMVSQWASGLKEVPAERCTSLERATDSLVRRWDLRPKDWHLIWPELIDADGAPAVPEVCTTASDQGPSSHARA
jgi:DNA-binding transcriptional regulator YdaS (Cro superfamily)